MSVVGVEAGSYLNYWMQPVSVKTVKRHLLEKAAKIPLSGSEIVPNRRAAFIKEVTGAIPDEMVNSGKIPLMIVVRAFKAGEGAAYRDLQPKEPTHFPPMVREINNEGSPVFADDVLVDTAVLPPEYHPTRTNPAPTAAGQTNTRNIGASGVILAAVRDQATNGRHDIRSVASFDGVKFLTNTELPLPFRDEFTWCPTISTKIGDELYLYHRFETALMLAGPKIYTYPEVEALREKMIRDWELNIAHPADPKADKLILTIGGRFQAIQIDFGFSQLGLMDLSKDRPGRLNNHGRTGLPNYVHIKSASPGRSESFSLDVDEEGGSFEDRIIEYWQSHFAIVGAVCSPRVAPQADFNVTGRRIADARLSIFNARSALL